MAKKLTKAKAQEMLHNPPHGKPLTEKQRKYFGAVANAQKGAEVDVDSVLSANKHLPWVQGLYDKDYGSVQIPGKKGTSTHFMESSDGLVYPTVVKNKKGDLKYIGKKARAHALKTGEYIKFPNDEQATWFGENYKKGTNVLEEYQEGGPITKDPNVAKWYNYLPKTDRSKEGITDSTMYDIADPIIAKAFPQKMEQFKKEKVSKIWTANAAQRNVETDPGEIAYEEEIVRKQLGEEGYQEYKKLKGLQALSGVANPRSRMLDPLGRPTGIDTAGQIPATDTPVYNKPIKGKTKLTSSFQMGGVKPDSVSNELMLRQLYRESGFNPKAGSSKGAKGLAQLKDSTVEELKNKRNLSVDPYEPIDAIKGHKATMTDIYNKPWINKKGQTKENRIAKTLAAYNAGPTKLAKILNAQKAKGVDIYKTTDWIKALPKETQNYIEDITSKDPQFEKDYQKAIPTFKYKGAYPTKKQMGGPIEDNRGQWAHPGKVTKINSPDITMKGVPYPVLGISNTGQKQMMMPEQEYAFDGTSVTEYPMTHQDKGQLKKLDQLTSMAKSGIHIKESKKGTFTAAAKKRGKGVQAFASQVMANKEEYSPAMVKKANFAKNAAKWHKGQNGLEALASFTGGQAQGALDPSLKALQGKSGSSMNQALQGINPKGADVMGKLGGIGGALDIGTNLIQGVGMLKEEKKAKGQAEQFAAISDITKQASGLRPDSPKRKYARPEDMVFDPNQMSPSYGTGSNFLQMKRGGEIQNTYAPGTLYDGLEEIPRAQFGMQAGSLGSAAGSKLFGGTGEQSGAGKIGSTIGNVAGKFIPIPGASAVLGAVGGFIGGAIGAKRQKETADFQKQGEDNLATAAFQQGSQNIQNQYSGFMEKGGWISHDWQPQVITQFGGHKLKDLLKEDPTMDTLRSGGSLKEDYVQPTERALQTYAMGGNLKTHWGGRAESVSQNPYLPGEGESIEFKGDSHENGGIGVTYGNSPVEVEGGEPAVKLQSGGGVDNLVVFGDMKIPSYGVSEIGDPKAKGKKFKSYIKDLNTIEARQNKILDKGTNLINNADDKDPFERLTMNSGEAMLIGGNMKLKDLAKKKQMASIVQNAILETAKEQGLKSDELALGKIKKDKTSSVNAQDGATIFDKILNPNPFAHKLGLFDKPSPTVTPHNALDWNTKKLGALYAGETPEFNWEIPQFEKLSGKRGSIAKTTPITTTGKIATKQESITPTSTYSEPTEADYYPTVEGLPTQADVQQQGRRAKSDFGALDAIGAYLPYLRPSNQKNLDPNQLMGEMYALSANQLEPVQSQLYQPLLEQASDISLQDQLNLNQADFNALSRQLGNNPAALASLAAQKYQANTGVLGEQFRQNQARKEGVYNRNRGALNEATRANLSILDQQYQRQTQAKANTKAVAQAALNSISDKIAKNKLENRTLGIYENMYNYRFGPQGRAWNMNAPAQFNTEAGFTPIDEKGNLVETQRERTTTKAKKTNGGIVKAMKGY